MNKQMLLEALESYRPRPEEFSGYIEWRQTNTNGTYADYKKWRNSQKGE